MLSYVLNEIVLNIAPLKKKLNIAFLKRLVSFKRFRKNIII